MRLTVDGRAVPVRSFVFPGGEVQVRIEDAAPDRAVGARPEVRPEVRIEAHVDGSDALMGLLLLTDAVRRQYRDPAVELVCPYLPYARQDRVAFPGEALAAAVLCRMLNAQGYARVEVWDAHSDVSLALLDRVQNRPASDFAVPLIGADDVVVAPDAGAVKRAGACARLAGVPLVLAEKVRSTETGAITGTTVHSGHVGRRNFLIVDDICDGGRTFIELARALRPLTEGRVKLYVTHGIFSAGFDVLRPGIDLVYVANPFPAELPDFVQGVGHS